MACIQRNKKQKEEEKMTESAFSQVRRTAKIVEQGKKLEDSLRIVISAAHGRKADDIDKASKFVEDNLLKDSKLTELLRVQNIDFPLACEAVRRKDG